MTQKRATLVATLANVGTAVMLACLAVIALAGLWARAMPGRSTASASGTLDSPFARPVATWSQISAAGSAVGDPAAPIVLVIFSDYQCPACAVLDKRITALQQSHPGQVRVVHRHFPLSTIHPHAEAAAIAAECAHEQGRFASYNRALYANTEAIIAHRWVRLARLADVSSLAVFSSCIANRAPATRIAADVQAARRLHLSGTPGIILDGRLLRPGLSPERVEKLVLSHLRAHVATQRVSPR